MILSLCDIAMGQPPRQMNIYRAGGTMDSFNFSSFDSLAFIDSTALAIHLRSGPVTSIPLVQIDSIRFPFIGGPVYTVLSPNGGENHALGDSLTLSWRFNPALTMIGKVAVFLSPNDTDWYQLDLTSPYGNEPQVYNTDPRYNSAHIIVCKWKITNPISPWFQTTKSPLSSRCRIKVAGYEKDMDPEQYDISDAPFIIHP